MSEKLKGATHATQVRSLEAVPGACTPKPTPHVRQAVQVELLDAEKCWDKHGEHDELFASEKVPGPQTEHVSAPLAECEPAGQMEHTALPGAEYEPAGHTVQDALRPPEW